MIIIISLFIIAAIMGLIMLVQIFSNKKPDKILAYTHGLFAATSITLLLFQVLQGGNDKLVNLLMFVFVALIRYLYGLIESFIPSRLARQP